MTRGAALRYAAVCALLLAAAGTAAAQPAYRCSGPEGRVVYQQQPCAGGGQAVDVADPRSEAQRRTARETARDDARLAQQLERERRAREARRPAGASGFNARPVPPEPAEPAAKPQRYRVPGEGKPNKKKTPAAAGG